MHPSLHGTFPVSASVTFNDPRTTQHLGFSIVAILIRKEDRGGGEGRKIKVFRFSIDSEKKDP